MVRSPEIITRGILFIKDFFSKVHEMAKVCLSPQVLNI
jgi:hypothetical protein